MTNDQQCNISFSKGCRGTTAKVHVTNFHHSHSRLTWRVSDGASTWERAATAQNLWTTMCLHPSRAVSSPTSCASGGVGKRPTSRVHLINWLVGRNCGYSGMVMSPPVWPRWCRLIYKVSFSGVVVMLGVRGAHIYIVQG